MEQASLLPPPPAPLAERMRPRSLDEFVGQEHVIGPGTVLRRALEAGRLPSLVVWGPPGSGKTTLARLLARATGSHFVAISAVSAGVADLRRAVEDARQRRKAGQRTVLFVDELHRWNRAQQDAVLPFVETGLLTLVGATTENPSFEVNAALLSRCRVFRLEPLGPDQIRTILARALADPERGLGGRGVAVDDDALERLVAGSGGDARVALSALELAAQGGGRVDRRAVEDALQRRVLLHDRAGDQHYDVVSAFIKSVRGSDPDAAVYWLARMLEAGEDPVFVARRLVILAAEDVGLADPAALGVAVAAQQAAHLVGMPEAVLPLSEATLYLARAPKSNSALRAYAAAREDVDRFGALPVPLHLRNAVTGLMRSMGYGQGYRYPHDYPGGRVEQQYLPDALVGRRYYRPGDRDGAPGGQPAAPGGAEGAADGGFGAARGDRAEGRELGDGTGPA
jgi:putative ATPase